MVFPRPAGRCLCGHSSSSRCRLSVAWSFLAGNRLFEGSAAPAAAAAALIAIFFWGSSSISSSKSNGGSAAASSEPVASIEK